MTIAYARIAREVALRANLLRGGTPAARNTDYSTAPLTTTLIESIDVPLDALKDSILMAESEIAHLIGNSNNPQFRAALAAASASVASGGDVPLVSGSNPFVGVFDAIVDASDGTPLTEVPKRVLVRRVSNAGTFWKIPAYHYCIEGTKIFHTRTNVIFRGCVWDYTTQTAAYPGSNSPLPAELEGFWVAKTLASLARENWFVAEADFYKSIANEKAMEMIEGKVALLQLPSMPSGRARVNPRAD